jgi:membrane-anchored protein YejM (alkaline phosphatase superfamily)
MDDKIMYSLIQGGLVGSVFFISKNLYDYFIASQLKYEKEIEELKKNNYVLKKLTIDYLEEIEEKDKIINKLLEETKKKKKDNKIVIEYESESD